MNTYHCKKQGPPWPCVHRFTGMQDYMYQNALLKELIKLPGEPGAIWLLSKNVSRFQPSNLFSVVFASRLLISCSINLVTLLFHPTLGKIHYKNTHTILWQVLGDVMVVWWWFVHLSPLPKGTNGVATLLQLILCCIKTSSSIPAI